MKKILSAALALVCIWFATPALALPTGYTELEYIESTGTQYINTGVGLNAANKITGKISFVTLNTLSYIAGGRLSNSTAIGYALYAASHSGFTMYNATWPGQGVNISANQILEFETVMKSGQQSFIVNGDTIITGDRTISLDSNNIYLFGLKTEYMATAKIYYLKIYDNDTLVRNFIPAKDSSGVVGMYDTVNNRFYTNAGTGEFIAGPDACNGTIVNYTSATGTVSQAGTPTPTNPIEPTFYKQGNMILRAVGNYKDSYDASTGKITRRVGVKVFDGTEGWSLYGSKYVSNTVDSTAKQSAKIISSHFENDSGMRLESGNGRLAVLQTAVPDLSTAAELRTWFAQQYAAGTPVMLYYPLETETTEDWTETSYCETPIKIATTKYNETAFSPLNTALQNAISVVDTVVSNTITQAASIATLQAQKQTRPNDIADDNEKCPAGKKCLLVEDASGVPHWYEIVENAWDLPVGYTQLQWIESTGTQYIDTGIKPNDVDYIIADFQYTNTELIPSAIIAAASNSIYNYFGEHTAFRGFGENWGNASTWKTFDIAHNTNRHIWKADLSNSSEGIVKFYLDENLVTTQTGAQNSDANFTISSLAFASLRSTQGKYYSVKFEKNNALIRDFVPAKNPDGKIGMYDKVNGVFYENQGTGEFVAGDPVSE